MLRTNEEREPTGKSTAFERIYEFIALRNRMPCFDSIKAPNNRGFALEIAFLTNIITNIITRNYSLTSTESLINRTKLNRKQCILLCILPIELLIEIDKGNPLNKPSASCFRYQS
jgi:hypothetical protein